jgi:transcriptional regulator of acetoin/glycerol metabolism
VCNALQEREVVPVGEVQPVSVDVRVVAATHRDLGAGPFRPDLLGRLSGLSVTLPPLRERREDLGLIIANLLARLGAREARFAPRAVRALCRHGWPRNIRELELTLRGAVLLAGGGEIDLAHVRVADAPDEPPRPAPLSPSDDELRASLVAALQAHEGNVAAVARALGKGRMQIHRWLRRFGLDLRSFRSG